MLGKDLQDQCMTNTFFLYDFGRFSRILILVILLHLIFLLGLDIYPHSSPPLKRKMATMFDASLNSYANERAPKVAIHIASRNHASLVLESKDDPLDKQATTETEVTHPASKASSHLAPSKIKSSKEPEPVTRKRTVSAASHEARDAEYLGRWQAYMEKFGNSHYPDIALKSNLRGNLRLLVAINKDGSLREVTIRQSSGSAVLDQAAINIVLKSAPFEPFPPELGDEIDVLEIIRTWQFRGKISTSS
jgi:TonB family protein